MEVYEVVTIPAVAKRQVEKVTHCTCDLCGARGSAPDYQGEVKWDNPDDNHNELSTAVVMAKGFSYPDGGDWTRTMFHICPACFKNELLSWFFSKGKRPTVKESEF
jgi:hypothetical protein